MSRAARFRTDLLAAALAVAVLLCPWTARAQQAFPFDHLTVGDGLSQGVANCIFQDSRGFMWFGTQDGLNRFDGYDFMVYKNNPDDSLSISDNFILSVAEDSSGTLWVSTRNTPSILNRFDRVTETFARVPRDSVDLSGAPTGSAYPSYTDPAGVKWSGIGSRGGGLTRLDTRTGKVTSFTHDPADPGSLVDDRVYSVAGDRSGDVWVATRGGLDRFDETTGKFTHFLNKPDDPGSLSDNFVWPLLVDRDGTLWAGTYFGGLNKYDPHTEGFIRIRHDEANPRSLAGDRVLSLAQDMSGVIWVGVGDHGVDRFHPDLTNFAHYVHDPGNKRGLADNNILSMYVDRSGFVWIGTREGLNRWDRQKRRFSVWRHDPNDPKSLAGTQVQTMLEDRSGTLWFGTMSDGLDRYDRTAGTFEHHRNDPGNPNSIPDNRIYALCEDRQGDLWVGTYGGGLARLDRKTGSFRTFAPDSSDPASLAAPGVWALLEARDGTLWVGTFGGGLERFDREKESFTHFSHRDADTSSISDNSIVCLLEDRGGNLWVGTTAGLNRLDKTSGAFRAYRERDGLPNEVIFGILEDNSGNLWMSTNKGISRLNPETEEFTNYNYADGLQGDEFNQAYARDRRTGELFFGGPNGFNAFNPDRIVSNTFVPPVVFSSFVRYNTDDAEGKPIREKGIAAKTEITLSYKDNVANFEFAALSYFNNDKNRYAYRLEGYSDRWIQLGTERRATFTNLDGGDYVLHVKGSNNDGVWNETGESLSITVTPPWWKTRWAYGSYALIFIAVLYVARKIEIQQREQKQRIRESDLRAKAVEAEKRALVAENARKTKELDDARVLQLSMLPREIPTVPGYDISVFMKTATEVGGDYYDFNLSPDGLLNVAFGDATGHGMQAGTIVTLMKGLFISEAAKFEIQKFFNHCSRAIKEIKLGRLYMALTLARFNGKSVSLSSAGMPPAYLHRKADGSIEEILLKAVPLGAMRSFPYKLYETTMEEGDTLLLMTDGLPEQKNFSEEMFDYARVIDGFRETVEMEPADIIHQLVSRGESWMEGAIQDDDITLMVVRKIGDDGRPGSV